ncbi:conserved hypothetical protein [Vibrio chagasii]|nr:conserved hypothetical protein [Vibrio chagasii]CAH7095317.1 conserved hypothetical protein [Vibrio chagasii]CAH7153954.1 conserved hypothetical protein [Vibrio chagasii]CAH7210714.1 conserved hypothetical protein [Vibrio chagasii]
MTSLGAFPSIYFGDKTLGEAHKICSIFDLDDKHSLAAYEAIGNACGFVVSGAKN